MTTNRTKNIRLLKQKKIKAKTIQLLQQKKTRRWPKKLQNICQDERKPNLSK